MDEMYKICLSVVAGTIASFTQEYGLLLAFVTVAIIMDIVTGIVKVSCTDEVWSRKKASQGFWHKASLFCGLALGIFLDFFIPFMGAEIGLQIGAGVHLSYIFGCYICLNELLSACQNLQCCNEHLLPSWVLRLLQSGVETIEQKMPEQNEGDKHE